MPQRTDIHKVLIIGSGPIVIGQACEFDYSGTQACKALRSLGYEIVLVNSNPATIMTDPEMADVTYIEPLNVARLEQIIAKERPDALLPNLGGQSGLNLASELYKEGILDKYNVKVIGVQIDAIERGEDRIEFKETMNSLGIEMARSEVAYSVEEGLAGGPQAAPQEETWVCNAQLSEPSGYAGETVRITLAQNDTIRTVFEGRTTFPYVLRVEGEPGVSEGMAYVYVLDDNGNVKTTTSYKGIVFQKQ